VRAALYVEMNIVLCVAGRGGAVATATLCAGSVGNAGAAVPYHAKPRTHNPSSKTGGMVTHCWLRRPRLSLSHSNSVRFGQSTSPALQQDHRKATLLRLSVPSHALQRCCPPPQVAS